MAQFVSIPDNATSLWHLRNGHLHRYITLQIRYFTMHSEVPVGSTKVFGKSQGRERVVWLPVTGCKVPHDAAGRKKKPPSSGCALITKLSVSRDKGSAAAGSCPCICVCSCVTSAASGKPSAWEWNSPTEKSSN